MELVFYDFNIIEMRLKFCFIYDLFMESGQFCFATANSYC